MGRTAAVLTVALLLAGAGVAEARPGGGSGGGHSSHSSLHSSSRSYSHSHGSYRPYYGSRIVVVGAPYYAYPRYYYPAPGYYAPVPAPAYIEQDPAMQGDWFYCPQYRAYYPQVQQCPGAWQRIAPRPPSGY